MKSPKIKTKKRLIVSLLISFIIVVLLVIKLGEIQIFKNDELKKAALQQWTKSITTNPKRGNIYDRKGKKLAISVNAFTVWSTNSEIKEKEIDETAKKLAEILDIEEEEVYQKLIKKGSTQKIKQRISREESVELKNLKLPGITVLEDTKRYYPNDNFASYVLGFTNIDNKGLDGIEYIYNDYLTGIPGKITKMTDLASRQLPYGGEKIHEAEDGSSLVLTIDEAIQFSAEKAAEKALLKTKARGVSVLMMDVNTGELLAMVNKPDFNPNNPREPIDEKMKKEWAKLSNEELQEKWYDLWRNPTINDIYEPGSTFKLITAAAAVEENTADNDTHYYCNGSVKISGRVLKCARWYDPHEDQTLRDAMANSCNVAFVQMGKDLGKEQLYKYIKAFGFGEKTNIDLLGEQNGIIPYSIENIKEINLATLSYGHGIAVTPIQLVTAISSIANGGDLLKPRIIKEVLNDDGDIIKSFKPEIVRKVISKETSDTVLSLMESVVSDGSGGNASIPGYKIGGKTGTAQKVTDGVYKKGQYMSSFVGVAPIDDPKVAILVVVDEPKGTVYGGSVAAPVVHDILEDTFDYLNISPELAKEESTIVEVPDVRGIKLAEAGKILKETGLKHTIETLNLENESIILDQYPLPDEKIEKGSIVNLFINERPNDESIIPFLEGKTEEEVIKILDDMNLKYDFKGKGRVFEQSPQPGEKVKEDSKMIVKFK